MSNDTEISPVTDPPQSLDAETGEADFQTLIGRHVRLDRAQSTPPAAATCYLYGFSLDDQPLVSGLADLPGHIVPAQATIPLLHEHIGAQIVVVFERGNAYRPIIIGRLGTVHPPEKQSVAEQVSVQTDGQRLTFSAEKEIVLRCGDASITLTRAGKILIQGKYILSRSSGYNKIKGAAVDIN
jgi:hypothetical protein